MMRDVDYSLWATEAAVATGLPVWVGVSVERRDDRRLAGFGRPEWIIEDIVATLMATGAKVCLVMHTAIDDTADALALEQIQLGGAGRRLSRGAAASRCRTGSSSRFPPEAFVEHCRRWRQMGATLLGGCCGIGPEHIAALSKATRDKNDVSQTPIAVHACAAPSASRSGGSSGRWSPATACNAASRPAPTCRRPPARTTS